MKVTLFKNLNETFTFLNEYYCFMKLQYYFRKSMTFLELIILKIIHFIS